MLRKKLKIHNLTKYLLFLLLLLLTGCQTAVAPVADDLVPPAAGTAASSERERFSESLYQYAVARLAGMEGSLGEAARALEKANDLTPDSAYLKVTLAEVYLHLEQIEKSFRLAEDALILDPELLPAHLLLASLYSRQDQYEQAVVHLEKAAQLDPEDERIPYQLALFYNRAGDMPQSIAVLKEIIDRSPEETYARLALARAYRQTALPALAEEAYRQTLEVEPGSFLAITELADLFVDEGRSDEAEKLVREKISEFPDNLRLRHRLVGQYVEQQRYDDALLQLGQILKIDPHNQTALRKSGLIHFERSDWSAAAGFFQDLVAIDAGDDQSRYYLGIAFEENSQLSKALTEFGKVKAASPVYADALIHQAYNLQQLERTAEAAELLEEHRELLSSRPEVFDYLSFLYNDLGHPGEALSVIEAGLDRYPEENTLLYRKMVLLDQTGKLAAAEQAAQRLLEVNPGHVNGLNFLAYSYAEQNIKLDQALAMAEKALAAADEPYIRDTLGWVLYRLGRFEEALANLLLAFKGAPADPVVHEHLGFTYKALGRTGEASKAFREALARSDRDRPDLRQLIENLEQTREKR